MRDYMLTLLVAATVTYLLTPLVRRIAARLGVVKEPRERDVHTRPVPLIGGIAMYAGLAAGLFVASQIPQLRDSIANTGMIGGLLAAGGLLVIIGIIDDRWGMSALTKAIGQVAAGGILVATGTQLNWLPLPGGQIFVPTPDQDTLLTILIVVATINAVNFIDGLDGLAAGIVAIAAVSFFIYYYSLTTLLDISRLAAPALASALLIGMCIGFLPHNFSPASIFMGDTGSMLLGLLLAYAPISSLPSLVPAEVASHINRYPEIMPLLLPAALLVIPYGDMLLAVVRRTRAGRSPFAPDRKHLHHRLLDIGHSQRASVLIMYLWAAAFSGSVVWLSIEKTEQPRGPNHHGEPIVVFVVVTVAALAVLLIMSVPWLRLWRNRAGRGLTSAGGPTAQAPVLPTTQPMLVVAGTRTRAGHHTGARDTETGQHAVAHDIALADQAGEAPGPEAAPEEMVASAPLAAPLADQAAPGLDGHDVVAEQPLAEAAAFRIVHVGEPAEASWRWPRLEPSGQGHVAEFATHLAGSLGHHSHRAVRGNGGRHARPAPDDDSTASGEGNAGREDERSAPSVIGTVPPAVGGPEHD